MTISKRETVMVVDFGGQYSHLIARRVRECNVYCEMVSYRIPLEKIKEYNPAGIIFSGGPSSVYQEGAPVCDGKIYDMGIPVLGICYGMQLMAHQLGGRTAPAKQREYGKVIFDVLKKRSIFADLDSTEQCWMSHGDVVIEPPPGFEVLARTKYSPVTAMADFKKNLYAVQFHPEVRHTPRGMEILKRFLFDVCGCRGDWNMSSFLEDAVDDIKRQVRDGRALCALSGGVDSSVAAVLVHRAVGNRLTCVFVNHGLLRKGEAEQVREIFQDRFNINLVYVDAQERFLKRLSGVRDPEQKRKTIGEEFIRVFEEEAEKLGKVDFLVQGTLYPDVVESGTDTAAVIKSHHNVGGLPDDMRLKLIEPLKWLFKDEVRVLGAKLGLPDEIVWRQPFPGPGLAVRILGEVTAEKLAVLREADAVVNEEIIRAGLNQKLWQWFAVLPAIKSVGVMGDRRTYARTIVVRAVNSDDAMTADWARLPHEVLEAVSNRLVNELPEVNRVVYDITSKPPGTIEWE